MTTDKKKDAQDRPKNKGGKDEPDVQPLDGEEPPPPPPEEDGETSGPGGPR